VLADTRRDLDALAGVGRSGGRLAIGGEDHVRSECATLIDREAINNEVLTLGYAVLLTANCDDCEHA
jgi:hypothetical protein